MNRKYLKRIFISLSTMGIMVLGTSVSAQEITDLSQNEIDHNSIITSCLTFSHLDSKVPSVSINDLEEYEILNHGVDFQFSSNLQVNNHDVTLITKEDASTGLEPFFMFNMIRVSELIANVRYYFIYFESSQKITIPIQVKFKKNDENWDVVNYSF